MTRILTALVALAFAAPAMAQTPPPAPTLSFKISMGGLNAGTFKSLTLPSVSITIAGDDVLVLPTTNAVDKRPIQLLDGKVSGMAKRILKDKVGQQMTVNIQIMPLGLKPGKRCKLLLDHAFLRGFSDASIKLEASGVPKIECTK